jgi:hypothetical protein
MALPATSKRRQGLVLATGKAQKPWQDRQTLFAYRFR